MDHKFKIDKYWKDIEKEISILKDTSLENANLIGQQSEKIIKLDYNTNIIDHNVKLSKWLLNLIDSTFGKLYQKIKKEPIKEKTNKKDISLNSNYLPKKYNLNQSNIEKDLEEIKEIHLAMNSELDKQNDTLEKINIKTDNVSDQLEYNLKKCKKIIRNK